MSNPYNPKDKVCLGGDSCNHVKCKCGHCKSYHLFNWDCQQLSRQTLIVCPCKKFAPGVEPLEETV